MPTEPVVACSVCGSENLESIEGGYGTGVFAPDGGEERWYWCGWRCRDCGAQEEE